MSPPFNCEVIDGAEEASPTDQFEGDLWGLYLAFEDPSGTFLDQHGLPDGSLFQMQVGASELEHQGLGPSRQLVRHARIRQHTHRVQQAESSPAGTLVA